MRQVFLTGVVALCGCATGFGADATGEVEIGLHGTGDSSGGLRFGRALLGVGHVELVAAEVEEPPDDGHGHGHAHLIRAARNHDHDDHEDDHEHVVVHDLLAGEAPLTTIEATVGAYVALHLELEAPHEGEAAGCAFFATGPATVEEASVPVRICAPGPQTLHVDAAFEVELDQTTPLELDFDLDRVLRGVSLAALERVDDGSIRIDTRHNADALAQVEENLARALSLHDDDHDH